MSIVHSVSLSHSVSSTSTSTPSPSVCLLQPWHNRSSTLLERAVEKGVQKGVEREPDDNHTKCCHLPFVRFCHLPSKNEQYMNVSQCLSLYLYLYLCVRRWVENGWKMGENGRAQQGWLVGWLVGKQIVKSSPESTSKLCVNTH